jgi:putative hydrolase of the HAD superfamily
MNLTEPLRAVTVDLDDTLYPQSAYLARAWAAVAAAGAADGISEQRLYDALMAECAKGSDRGGIIDRALEDVGGRPQLIPGLVETFRSFEPYKLDPYPGAAAALAELRRVVPVACVTDGDPAIQRAKLRALCLEDAFDAIVISDELGRKFRKPHPKPFLTALEELDVPPSAAIHVGDRPEKDIAGPAAAGMAGAVRVRQGEYAHVIDGPGAPVPLAVVHEVRAALRMIRGAAEGTATEPASGPPARAEATTPQGAERTALVAGARVSHAAADLRSNERHAFPQEAGRRVARVDQDGSSDSGRTSR